MTYPTHIAEAQAKDQLATPVGRANAALIRYPRFNKLHDAIRLCQDVSRIAGEPVHGA